MFFLRPDKTVNHVVEYCLAEAAQLTGVVLHAAVVISNHWHGVLHDPFGRLPEFLERFHKLTARCLNSTLGRTENFWASEQTSVVEVLTYDAVIEKMAYVIANPTTAGLVRSPRKWPGLMLAKLGEKRVVTRPDVFFREDGRMPEKVVLETKRPDIFNGLEDHQVQRMLDDAVAVMVRAARAKLKDLGRTFLGPKGVLKQSPFRVAASPEPIRQMKPRFAGRSRAALAGAIATWRRFLNAYRTAREAWRDGDRDRRFPFGTYLLRRFAGVRCADPAAPLCAA